jgi:quercetin dioxygenase-like cupin family protein
MKGTITRRIWRADNVRGDPLQEGRYGAAPRPRQRAVHVCGIEGALKFWFGDDGKQEVVVSAGEVVVIPSNLPHRAEALHDTVEFDIFSPPRQDWLDKTDSYLRN